MIYADNYRDVLKKLIAERPRGEIARISEHLDVAPTLVSQVLSGSRHFTFEQSFSVANYFRLPDLEKDYFLATVHKDRASNQDLKKYWTLKMKEILRESESVRKKVNANRELDDAVKTKFYSSYLYSAVRLFCSIGRGKSVDDISEKFKISKPKTNSILNFLTKNNLVILHNGIYTMSPENIHVPKESDHAYRHHTNWRLKSLSHLEEVKDPELSFTCPCSLDKDTFIEIKNDIMELIKKAAAKAQAAPAEEIACLNIDLFWIDS